MRINRTIGYRADGTLTWFGRHWHLSDGKLLWLRYAVGRWSERLFGYEPDSDFQRWFPRWLGLSGYEHLYGDLYE